jgi:hypothetical protein
VRTWAFHDPEVREVQTRVDQSRIDALQGIWTRIVDDPDQARVAALPPYLVAVGVSLALPPRRPEELRRVYELLLSLVPDPSSQIAPTRPEERLS